MVSWVALLWVSRKDTQTNTCFYRLQERNPPYKLKTSSQQQIHQQSQEAVTGCESMICKYVMIVTILLLLRKIRQLVISIQRQDCWLFPSALFGRRKSNTKKPYKTFKKSDFHCKIQEYEAPYIINRNLYCLSALLLRIPGRVLCQ